MPLAAFVAVVAAVAGGFALSRKLLGRNKLLGAASYSFRAIKKNLAPSSWRLVHECGSLAASRIACTAPGPGARI